MTICGWATGSRVRNPMYSILDGLHLSIAGSAITPSNPVWNLGVMWDSYLNMDKHVSAVIKSCNFHLSRIARIRPYLTVGACKTLIQAWVIARLDYKNSTLCGLPVSLLTKLQKVQNRATRLVTGTSGREHITPKLKQLHWLPVEYRIRFKMLVITYIRRWGCRLQGIWLKCFPHILPRKLWERLLITSLGAKDKNYIVWKTPF